MSNTVSEKVSNGVVNGFCAPGFERVAEAFLNNFNERGESGANVCLTHEGKTVVDLWGGVADPATDKPWDEDTLSIVFSSTKGIMSLCAHMLLDQGKLDLKQPVAEIWPEFAVNGKETATVEMMLNHTVGVPVFKDQVPQGLFYDWDAVTKALAEMEPWWQPGNSQGYHAVTFAWTVGELIRRVTGKSPGTIIQEFLSQPLGLDLWCGLPEEQEHRVAPMQPVALEPGQEPSAFVQYVFANPGSISTKFLMNDGGFSAGINSREAHAAEIPSANGITNGRGLAGAYRPFANGGTIDGKTFVSDVTLARMGEVSAATNRDETLIMRARFGLGFMMSMDNRASRDGMQDSAIMGRHAFGHVGAGGSLGFADPDAALSFGYNMNKMGASIMLNERGQDLVDAAYLSLGYKDNAPGFWRK